MPSLFKQYPPFEKIELLSVHLPKSGGISFLRSLQNIYGKKLWKAYSSRDIKAMNTGNLKSLSSRLRAIHGHFEVNEYTRGLFPDAKIICWLRNPVDRVYSHYHYWLNYPEHENPVHQKFLKEKPTLQEFIINPEYLPTIQAINSFLGRIDPSEIYYAGRLEYFNKDLIILARLMNWNEESLSFQKENQGRPQTPPPDKQSRDLISSALQSEMALYRQLVTMHHP